MLASASSSRRFLPVRFLPVRFLPGALALALLAAAPAAAKIPDNEIDIGVIDSAYAPSDIPTERGAVIAASMAADDFGKYAGPIDVEVHGANRAAGAPGDLDQVKSWITDKSEHVELVVDAAGSPDAGAIARFMAQHDRSFVVATVAGTVGGPLCAPNVLKWGPPPAVIAGVIAANLANAKRHKVFALLDAGGYSNALLERLGPALHQAGLTLTGDEEEPIGAPGIEQRFDMAAHAGADAVVLLMSGPDLRGAVVRAYQDGALGQMTLVAPEATQEDILELGLNTAHGLLVPGDYYWNLDTATREFAGRFLSRMRRRNANATEAAVYAGVLAYLDAARATQSIDAGTISRYLVAHAPKTTLLGPVKVAGGGMVQHAMHVFQVALPSQVTTEKDVFIVAQTIPADKAYDVGSCGTAQ